MPAPVGFAPDQLGSLKYRQLQTLCKSHGIKANLKTSELVRRLTALHAETARAESAREDQLSDGESKENSAAQANVVAAPRPLGDARRSKAAANAGAAEPEGEPEGQAAGSAAAASQGASNPEAAERERTPHGGGETRQAERDGAGEAEEAAAETAVAETAVAETAVAETAVAEVEAAEQEQAQPAASGVGECPCGSGPPVLALELAERVKSPLQEQGGLDQLSVPDVAILRGYAHMHVQQQVSVEELTGDLDNIIGWILRQHFGEGEVRHTPTP